MNKVTSLIIIFICLTFVSFAQSDLELAFVKQINIYRKQHSLGFLVYDSSISKVALIHAQYLKACTLINHYVHFDQKPHDEQFDIAYYSELNFDERVAIIPAKNIYGEISIQGCDVRATLNNDEISQQIIAQFNSSPHHKELMLENDDQRYQNTIGLSILKTESIIKGYTCFVVNIDFGVDLP